MNVLQTFANGHKPQMPKQAKRFLPKKIKYLTIKDIEILSWKQKVFDFSP